jgi:hypothetical protein
MGRAFGQAAKVHLYMGKVVSETLLHILQYRRFQMPAGARQRSVHAVGCCNRLPAGLSCEALDT